MWLRFLSRIGLCIMLFVILGYLMGIANVLLELPQDNNEALLTLFIIGGSAYGAGAINE